MRMRIASLLTTIALLVLLPALYGGAQSVSGSAQAKRARLAQLGAEVQQHLRANEPQLAIAGLRKIVKLDPANADAHGNLGVLLYFQRDYADAVPELRTALKLQPGIAKIEALLGLAEDRTGDGAGGRREMENAFSKIEEENIQSEVGLALASSYMRGGEPDKAAAALSALLRVQPTNRVALYRSYRIFADLADRSLLTLGMTAPGSAELYVSMGRELARYHDDDAAIQNYRQAAALEPAFPGLHTELGRLLFSSSDPATRAQARPEFEAALAVDPNDQQANLLLGMAEQRDGLDAAARKHLERAVELDPDNGDAAMELAKVLTGDEDRVRTIHLLECAIASDPTNYVAHFRLSTLYRQMGRKDDAKHEAAEYQKYKQLSERLQKLFNTMRLGNFDRKEEDDASKTP